MAFNLSFFSLFQCFPVPVYDFQSVFSLSLKSSKRSLPESSNWTDNCLNRCGRLSAAWRAEKKNDGIDW